MSRRRAALLVVAVIGLSACGGDSARTASNASSGSVRALGASSAPSTTSVTIDTTTSSGASGALDATAASSSSSSPGPGPISPAPGDTPPGATEPATTAPAQPGETTTLPPPPPPTTTTTTTTTPPPASGTISIKNFTFSPNPLQVAVGTLVTTTNDEAHTSHTWTSDTGAWDSGTLAAGQSYAFTFSSVGTFTYHCSIHASMTGSVVVS